MLVHEVPIDDVKVGVWCAMSASRITGPIFPWGHTFTPVCSHWNDSWWSAIPDLRLFSVRQWTAHYAFCSVFGDNIKKPVASSFARSQFVDFLFLGHVKGLAQNSNNRSEGDLKEKKGSILGVIPSTSSAKLRHAINNMYMTLGGASESRGKPFLALPKNMMSKTPISPAKHWTKWADPDTG